MKYFCLLLLLALPILQSMAPPLSVDFYLNVDLTTGIDGNELVLVYVQCQDTFKVDFDDPALDLNDVEGSPSVRRAIEANFDRILRTRGSMVVTPYIGSGIVNIHIINPPYGTAPLYLFTKSDPVQPTSLFQASCY